MTATLGLNLENWSQQHNNVKGLQKVVAEPASRRLLPGFLFIRMPLISGVIEGLRSGRITHGVEPAQHGLLVRAQALHKSRIVQSRLPLLGAHLLQSVKAPCDHLPAVRRHLLPFRQKSSLHVLPLFGRHALPRSSAVF